MSLFWREKPDGRRGPGYLVYLLGGLTTLAAVMILHHRSASAERAPRRRAGDHGADIASITAPAALMTPVRVAAKSARAGAPSYRLEPPREPAAGDGRGQSPAGRESFDAIAAALAGPPVSGTGAAYPPLPPAFPPAETTRSGGNASEERMDRAGLLAYRDGAADISWSAAAGPPAEAPPGADGDFAPRGSLIAVYLLTTVDTSNPAAVIQFGTARSLIYHCRCEVAFGTRFLGRLQGRPMRGRLNLAADTLLFPDGLELPVSASAVEADEQGAHIRPGVAADYFPPPAWVRAAPYVSNLFSGFMGLLESRAQAPYAVAAEGGGAFWAPSASPRGPLYQASGQAIQDFAAARLRDWEERYAPYFLIPAGTACWLQLEADLDLSAARLRRKLRRRGRHALFPCR